MNAVYSVAKVLALAGVVYGLDIMLWSSLLLRCTQNTTLV
jgi:hypothetical protein